MKNNYIVKFTDINGQIAYIISIGINLASINENYAYKFTNKKVATRYAKYFVNYIMSTVNTFEVIKL